MLSKAMPMKKRWICTIGYVLSPALFCIYFFVNNPRQNNWTGLLSNPQTQSMAIVITFLLGLDVLSALWNLNRLYRMKHAVLSLFLFSASSFLTVVFPYGSTHIATQLHLLFALLCFLAIHLYLFQLYPWNQKAFSLYFAFLFLALLCIITSYHIDGYSEMVLGVGLRWLITTLQKEKM